MVKSLSSIGNTWENCTSMESRKTSDVDTRLVKMVMLDEVSVYPTVIARQRVQPCLNVSQAKQLLLLNYLYGEPYVKDICNTGKLLIIVAE